MEKSLNDEQNYIVNNIENMILANRAKKRMASLIEEQGISLEEAIKLGYNPEEEASLSKEEKLILDAEYERFMSEQDSNKE